MTQGDGQQRGLHLTRGRRPSLVAPCRAEEIGPQFVARHTGDPLDVRDASNRNFIPLQDGGRRDAQTAGQLAGTADVGDDFFQRRSMCVHAVDIS